MGEPTLLTQVAEAILEVLRPRPQDTWEDRRERVKQVLKEHLNDAALRQ